jgi:ribonuclease BN (tRNA processing enzyme)
MECMKIRFIGVGSAFTNTAYYQSNMLLSNTNDRHLLLDCGTDARYALAEQGFNHEDLSTFLEGVYISHLHADHIGGLEWLAFTTYFGPTLFKPLLFAEEQTLYKLWEHSLQGGLDCIEGKMMHLTDYFECRALPADGCFIWQDLKCRLHQMEHILSGYDNHYSYGLQIAPASGGSSIFISTDAQFRRERLLQLAEYNQVLFHDCETSTVATHVHAHYEELRSLPAAVKAKMWLYHYDPQPPYDAKADGFCGFVSKGQCFEF